MSRIINVDKLAETLLPVKDTLMFIRFNFELNVVLEYEKLSIFAKLLPNLKHFEIYNV